MKKIQIEEVVIKSPGVQIREKIAEKFGSIKVFGEKINLYEASINQYLSSKGLGSANFKIRTTEVFGQSFDSLYMTEEEQVRYMTTAISSNIDLYNKFEDINIFEKLKKICIEKELYEDYAIVCRCYGKYYMNKGKRDRAYAYIELAANAMRGKKNVDRFTLYLSDLILMEAKDMSKTKLKRLLNEAYSNIKKLKESSMKGYIYTNLGDTFSKLKDYEKSKFYYKKVLKYIDDDREKALVYTKIGDIEKHLGYSRKAILTKYRKAENLLDEEDSFIKYVYHEYALYYLKCGYLKKAESYIDKIFFDNSWKISSSNHKFLITFVHIKSILNKETQIVEIINMLLKETEYSYIYTISHLYLIDKIIAWKKNNEKLLKELNKSIINYYLNNKIKNDYKNVLKMILGSIAIGLNK
ncbi:hypothetical protein [Clostridium oceanicum]|uniref:Tetratricopeptide repeat protein n=1 Tax=Clostridium oceanicum TaxID=1543 RepID=A0ABP3UJQ3_9CLOT